MTVPLRVLAMGEEALRDHEMEIVPGARHRHIEEAPLLLDLGRGAGAAVRCVEEVGFAVDSPLEEAVSCELVSKSRFPVTRENTANYVRLRGAAPVDL
jgi:hypothetical protein